MPDTFQVIGSGEVGTYYDLELQPGRELREFWCEIKERFPGSDYHGFRDGSREIVRVVVWKGPRAPVSTQRREEQSGVFRTVYQRLDEGDPFTVIRDLGTVCEIRFDNDGYFYIVEQE